MGKDKKKQEKKKKNKEKNKKKTVHWFLQTASYPTASFRPGIRHANYRLIPALMRRFSTILAPFLHPLCYPFSFDPIRKRTQGWQGYKSPHPLQNRANPDPHLICQRCRCCHQLPSTQRRNVPLFHDLFYLFIIFCHIFFLFSCHTVHPPDFALLCHFGIDHWKWDWIRSYQ